jgi:hypothetical protein
MAPARRLLPRRRGRTLWEEAKPDQLRTVRIVVDTIENELQ